MALFNRRGAGGRRATRDDLAQLREWVAARQGVEAFMEPPTTVEQTTVVLVASDGEWTRRRVTSAKAAADFARKAGIPLYDANRVGYPQRMREYNVRQKQGAAGSAGRSGPTASSRPWRPTSASGEASSSPPARSSSEREAIVTLAVSAGLDAPAADPGEEELRRMWKRARSRSHPDRRGGDRTEWDQVEEAARALRLSTD